jgi:hypothetical protein
MGTRGFFISLALVAMASLFTACGGDTMMDTLDPGSDAQFVAVEADTGWSGLPAIPLDTDEDKVVAETDDSGDSDPGFRSVLGVDYLQMQGGYEEGTAVVLECYPETDPDDVDPEEHALSYAMYRVSGLDGLRPLSFNVECLPGGLGQGYFIGIADYTKGVWKWFGPSAFPEYEIDLYKATHQFVTHLGNMYFMVVVPPGNSATHYRSTVIVGPPGPETQPGIPHHLVASDGQFPEQVRLSWVAGNAAGHYQIFRRAAWGENTEWQIIGESNETRYVDAPLPDYKMFYYRVRSLNAAGESFWSNVDTGFAGGGDDPCVIHGDVTTVMGEPVAGIAVSLVGLDDQMLRITNEEGKFYFGDLPPGEYIVAARHEGLVFAPPYHHVDLTETKVADIHFNAMLEWSFHRVFGFAFTFSEDESGPRFVPMPGVDVRCQAVGDPGAVWEAETNEDGFWLIEDLPVGIYLATAHEEGWGFFPPVHEVVVNGHNRPDRCDFLGFQEEGPGDPE